MGDVAHSQLGRMRLWNNRYSAPAPPAHALAAARVLATNTTLQACAVGILCACIARFAFADAITPTHARSPSWALFAVGGSSGARALVAAASA